MEKKVISALEIVRQIALEEGVTLSKEAEDELVKEIVKWGDDLIHSKELGMNVDSMLKLKEGMTLKIEPGPDFKKRSRDN